MNSHSMIGTWSETKYHSKKTWILQDAKSVKGERGGSWRTVYEVT